MGRLSLESTFEKTVVVRNFYWVEVYYAIPGYLECLMLDLEWRLAGLGNLVGPLAALGCHRFLQLKASRISRNIQAESRKFVSY